MSICKIYTIGHSTLEFGAFLQSLTAFGVEVLVDVRSHPASRRYPHFGKESLCLSLPQAGIEYAHFEGLGGRRKNYSQTDYELVAGWTNQSFQSYAFYTLTEEYENGIATLLALAQNKVCCLMCAESVPWRCHRLLISNTLLAKGADVFHIASPAQCTAHRLNLYGAYAEIKDGKVIYPLPLFAGK